MKQVLKEISFNWFKSYKFSKNICFFVHDNKFNFCCQMTMRDLTVNVFCHIAKDLKPLNLDKIKVKGDQGDHDRKNNMES